MSAVDTSKGFKFRYRLNGGQPTIVKLLSKDTATHTKGDLVNLESGEVQIAATNDNALVGAVNETKSCTDSTTYVEVIVDADAVYGVYDANARLAGATLDLSGATGAMTVATSSNVDLLVVAPSSATEETLVMIAHGEHFTN